MEIYGCFFVIAYNRSVHSYTLYVAQIINIIFFCNAGADEHVVLFIDAEQAGDCRDLKRLFYPAAMYCLFFLQPGADRQKEKERQHRQTCAQKQVNRQKTAAN